MVNEVMIPQFELVSGTNDDLEDLVSFHNLGNSNSKNWFLKSDDTALKIYSTTSLTASSTSEHTYNTSGGAHTNYVYRSQALRSFGATIIASAIYTSDDGGGTYGYSIFSSYSTDNGSSWTDALYESALYSVVNITTQYIQDVFALGTDYFVLFFAPPSLLTTFLDIKNGTLDTGTAQVYEGSYAGKVIGSDYYYVLREDPPAAPDNYQIRTYDGTTDSTYETLSGISVPTSFNNEVQLYWKQGNTEIIMDEDHLYSRVGTNAWQSKSGSGETTNAVIWGYDADGNLIIVYIIWKDTIFEITEGGGLAPIQDTFENAYVGWKDWFANGADKIFQINHTTERYGHTLKFLSALCQYEDGICKIADQTNYTPKIIDWGTWTDPNLDAWTINASIDTAEIVKEQSGQTNPFHIIADAAEEVAFPFTARDDGEVEFYIELAQTNKIVYIRLDSTSGTSPCQVEFQSDGNIDFTGASSDTDIQAYSADTMYHIRIVFAKNSTCELYLNGILISSITGNNVQSDQFYVVSGSADAEFYIDDVGFSWAGYITYSNLLTPWKKGDFITLYDYRHELAFKGFIIDILDDNAKVKIMVVKAGWRIDLERKITYSISADTPDSFLPTIASANFEFSTFDVKTGGGSYTQAWKNLSVLSKLPKIVKRETWVWYADIETNTIYLDDGTERAIVDYKRAIPGVVDWGVEYDPDLSDWTDSSGSGCQVSIVDKIGHHKNPIELDDQSTSNIFQIEYDYGSAVADNVFELYVRIGTVQSSEYMYVLFEEGSSHNFGTTMVQIEIRGNGDIANNGSVIYSTISANQWYHLRVVCDDTANTYDLYLDGVLIGSSLAYRNNSTTGTRLFALLSRSSYTGTFYVDALARLGEGYTSQRIFYLHAQSTKAKIGNVRPKTNTRTVSKAYIAGKIVNGQPTEGFYEATAVNFGDVIRDSEPNEGNETVLDTIAQNIVTQGNVEYLEVVCFFFLMSPIQWGRQIYFDFPSRRFDYPALGAPDLYFTNKSEYEIINNWQKAGFSSILLFKYEKTTVQDGASTKEVLNDGITPEVNEQRIIDTEDRVTWTDAEPVDGTPNFDETDLTNDTNWNDLDISSIIGAKKCRVQIDIHAADNTTGSEIYLRTNGVSYDAPNILYSAVANQEAMGTRDLETDDDGIIEIKCNPQPTSWTFIEIYIIDCRDA